MPTDEYTAMRPARDAGRPSSLALNPRNREASTARRRKLLAAFDSLDVNTRADLLEAAESMVRAAGMTRERDTARGILRLVYAAAGWEDETP